MSELIQPLGSRVLIRVLEEESVTASGLVIPDTAKEKGQRGEVKAVGDDEEMIKVSVGDRVLFAKYAGTELRLDGDDYLVLEATDLLAVIRSEAAASNAA
jgi:chaperonin GroES